MNLRFLQHETTKLGPQRIMVKSSHTIQPPLLPQSSMVVTDSTCSPSIALMIYLIRTAQPLFNCFQFTREKHNRWQFLVLSERLPLCHIHILENHFLTTKNDHTIHKTLKQDKSFRIDQVPDLATQYLQETKYKFK